MKVFTVHLRREGLDPERDIVLVKEGFSWPAFLLTVLWALWQGLWLPAAVMVGASVALGGAANLAGAGDVTAGLMGLGLSAIIGFVANDLRRDRLQRDGFADAGVVCGPDSDAALLLYLSNQTVTAPSP